MLAGEAPSARPLRLFERAARWVQRHALLFTLAALLALVLAAALTYGSIRKQEMAALWRSVSNQVAHQTTTEVRRLLEPALPLVLECEALARWEDLPVEGDQIELGRKLEKRFRYRNLDWLCFGGADKRFTGVWRRGDEVLLNRSWPTPDGRVKLVEEVLAATLVDL